MTSIYDEQVLEAVEQLYAHFVQYDDVFISEIPDVNTSVIIDSFPDLEERIKKNEDIPTKTLLSRLLMKYEYAEMSKAASEAQETKIVESFNINDGRLFINEFNTEKLTEWFSTQESYGVGTNTLRDWVILPVIDMVAELIETTASDTDYGSLINLLGPIVFKRLELTDSARKQLISIIADKAKQDIVDEISQT